MLAYSAMKNMANLKLEYSVWKPATSSVSASGKIKGNAVRFGDRGGDITEKTDDLRERRASGESMPVVAALAVDNFVEVQRSRQQQHADDRERQRQLRS